MNQLLETAERISASNQASNGKTAMEHLGFIFCGNRVQIRHVPFFDPCIIVILSGEKTIFDNQCPVTAGPGCAITVPAPSSYDLRNEPDKQNNRYRALVIPFTPNDLEQLSHLHGFGRSQHQEHHHVLKFDSSDQLTAAVQHYLDCPDDAQILKHRLIEILLHLTKQNTELLSYATTDESWAQRVRTIINNNIVYAWTAAEVSGRLATSETTLRRKLRHEETSFREILFEARLANGLMQLLQSSKPVYQVAFDCGYQSVSRFTSNFRKRFGLSPTELRSSMDENG